MKKLVTLCLLFCFGSHSIAQQVFTLDSCRNMAIRNNKQLKIAGEKIKAAQYTHKSAVTNFLPSLDFTGAYLYNQKNLSLLAEDAYLPTKSFNLATQQYEYNIVKNPVTGAPIIGPNGQPIPETVAMIPKEAFEFDIRNTFVGAVSLTQPIFMGGKILAYNKITKFAEELAKSQHNTAVKEIVLTTDQAYWQVVSLVYKKKLAESYASLLDSLSNNVTEMINAGVATQSDGLTVAVRLNEAQITLTKVENGLSLSKMLLAQLCGLPVNSEYNLYDETMEPSVTPTPMVFNMDEIYSNRSEINSLRIATRIYEKKQDIVVSEMLPHIALTGSYLLSNPNAFNGFDNKFAGMFNVGVMVQVPLLRWGGNVYKLKAAKASTRIAKLELEDVKEKVELQVNQAAFKVNEAIKKLEMTHKNMTKAEENLRNAQIGFEEGVLTTSNVLEAQTAWLQAQSEKIDAQIDVRLCDVYLSQALGKTDN